jgi:acylglycerol lipase
MITEDTQIRRILNTPPDLSVRSTRGDLLPVRTWMPAGAPRRVVVALHGMVTHSGWFAQLGDLLRARGIAVLAPDRRGNGHARGLQHVDDVELLIDDVDVVVRQAHALCADVTLLSWCGSANFAVPAAQRVAVQRFVMASPGLVPLEVMSTRFRSAEPVDGFLPIHFDPATDFTDDEATRALIRSDELYLRRIPVQLRAAWRALNPRAREALTALPVPTSCVLTRVDRMIDIAKTVELLGDVPVSWAPGGHGFVVELAGARLVADLLEAA